MKKQEMKTPFADKLTAIFLTSFLVVAGIIFYFIFVMDVVIMGLVYVMLVLMIPIFVVLVFDKKIERKWGKPQ
ncbi:MAG: hypothetical protein K5790_10575 [Nitrosopumilus sp.]|uniref:hypothetical protein n=1 Tax=Nitrosopumilus sp. TaxID=2024843 RepID=UPI00247B7A99|nr:hypothetical protein [Nitrosopumilus sp.]MCV0393715.1 hypothetical protein [Nitrosopumilus sp.]